MPTFLYTEVVIYPSLYTFTSPGHIDRQLHIRSGRNRHTHSFSHKQTDSFIWISIGSRNFNEPADDSLLAAGHIMLRGIIYVYSPEITSVTHSRDRHRSLYSRVVEDCDCRSLGEEGEGECDFFLFLSVFLFFAFLFLSFFPSFCIFFFVFFLFFIFFSFSYLFFLAFLIGYFPLSNLISSYFISLLYFVLFYLILFCLILV